MNIAVIGAGALGKLYGGLATLNGHSVHYLLRSEYNTIAEQDFFDIHFQEKKQTQKIASPKIYQSADALPVCDIVLACVKTTENNTLSELIKPCLSNDSSIVLIQNGIGNEEFLHQHFPDTPLIAAISTAAVTRKEQAMVDVYFLGELRLAAFNAQAKPFIERFQQLFKGDHSPNFKAYNHHKLMRWQKLVWNIPFAGLSIVYDKSAQTLALNPDYQATVRKLMQEVQAIAKSEGAEIGDDYLEKTLTTTQKVENYYPSMYWDFKQGKAIELEFLYQNPLNIAKQNQVSVPQLTQTIEQLMHALEQRCR